MSETPSVGETMVVEGQTYPIARDFDQLKAFAKDNIAFVLLGDDGEYKEDDPYERDQADSSYMFFEGPEKESTMWSRWPEKVRDWVSLHLRKTSVADTFELARIHRTIHSGESGIAFTKDNLEDTSTSMDISGLQAKLVRDQKNKQRVIGFLITRETSTTDAPSQRHAR